MRLKNHIADVPGDAKRSNCFLNSRTKRRLQLGNVIYDRTRRMIICLPSKPAKGVSPTLPYSPRFLRRSSVAVHRDTSRTSFHDSIALHGPRHFASVIVIKLDRATSFPLRARAYNRLTITAETAVTSHARLISNRCHRSCDCVDL